MADKPNTQIIIRHIAGAKINRIDPFGLHDTKEITFGREAASAVAYDSPKDDVVSRRHAVLRVKGNGTPSFWIEDLKSSNGTFVNGERISGESELLPDDTVEFGKGGPKFSLDVQPRPAGLSARTRVMSAIDATATRAVATTAVTGTAVTAVPGSDTTRTAKAGIGKNTVMMLLSDERKKTSQVWMGALAAVVAFFVVGGGVLYWNSMRTAERVQLEAQEQSRVQAEKVRAEATSATQQIAQQLGMTPGEVVNKFGNSTVWINVSWRMFDKETGRPVYHKRFTAEVGKVKRSLPGYLKINGKIYPWFTTDDEEHKNYEIKSSGSGSGFVVSESGFILTNKHVATGWMTHGGPDKYLTGYGITEAFVITPPADKKSKVLVEVVSLASLPADIQSWNPGEDGAPIFSKDAVHIGGTSGGSVATPSDRSPLLGKNEILEVRFAGSGLSINASNVRQSTFADAALIKIDSPQALTPIEISSEDAVKVGERVIVLGYPGISTRTLMEVETAEKGRVKSRIEVIPEPTVTEGIVSKLGTELTQSGSTKIVGSLGDAFQLSINSTGSGNSGGPVFNSSGKVIGLYTYGSCSGRTCVSHAVPIKHARFLLSPQRTQ